MLGVNEEDILSSVDKLVRESSITESERRRRHCGNRENRRSALIKSKKRTSALHDEIVSVSSH
jgi:hypothetical protein